MKSMTIALAAIVLAGSSAFAQGAKPAEQKAETAKMEQPAVKAETGKKKHKKNHKGEVKAEESKTETK
jgi:hypothetical protein